MCHAVFGPCHADADVTIVRTEVDGVAEQDVEGLTQQCLVVVELQFRNGGQEIHLARFVGNRRYVALAVVMQEGNQVAHMTVGNDGRLINRHFYVILDLVGLVLHAHLVHPLLLLQVTAHVLHLHVALLTAQEPASPPECRTGYYEDVEQHGPACAPQCRPYGDVERRFHFAKGTVVVQHAYMKRVAAGPQ